MVILAYYSDSCCAKRLYPHKGRILSVQVHEGEVWLTEGRKSLY